MGIKSKTLFNVRRIILTVYLLLIKSNIGLNISKINTFSDSQKKYALIY